MIVNRRLEGDSRGPFSVAVIASSSDLERAAKLRHLPDLFELRLDAFAPPFDAVKRLRAPLIITARDSREGGLTRPTERAREKLLLTALPMARFVDVELHSARAMSELLRASSASGVRRILSVHALDQTTTEHQMKTWFATARTFAPAVFKIVVRTDTAAELDRLVHFFEQHQAELPISAMGFGRMGRRSRIALAQLGSALNYAHLGKARISGQLSLLELRRLLKTISRPAVNV